MRKTNRSRTGEVINNKKLGSEVEGQPKADPQPLENKKNRRPPRSPKTEAEKKEAWRKKTKRKMKKAPRTTVREELPDVLVSLVEVAREGSCPHAKILMEFADAENIPDAKEKQRSQTLAEMLIERIDGRK
jgi:hypothetical protein